jgi:hypothetical protein
LPTTGFFWQNDQKQHFLPKLRSWQGAAGWRRQTAVRLSLIGRLWIIVARVGGGHCPAGRHFLRLSGAPKTFIDFSSRKHKPVANFYYSVL